MVAKLNAGWSALKSRLSQRTRWEIHSAILCCPVILAVLSLGFAAARTLPRDTFHLVHFVMVEIIAWGAIFVMAFRFSDVTPLQLRLGFKKPLATIGFGILWFLVIRVLAGLIIWAALKGVDQRSIWANEEKVSSFINASEIRQQPGFSLTVYGISAVIAGFSEELWRAGMLAGVAGIFPQAKGKGLGALLAIIAVALIFGVAHLYQGWIGVAEATLAGIFLGAVMVLRNSYWEAAIAHVLYDALSFGLAALFILNTHVFGNLVVYSASRGDLPKLQHWVTLGGDVNATTDVGDWKGLTALDYAVQKPNPDVVRFLLDHGASPNLKDGHGRTPLIIATEQNRLENMKLLIANGANLNDKNNSGFTALRSAAEYNRLDAAQILIESGADVNIADTTGATPLAAAEKWRYLKLTELLVQHGAR
jgi:membrane protease YdiL (CAAX protease family)